MIGARNIQWIWDWLGQGNTGEEYSLIPVVQPTVQVLPFEMQPRWQRWNLGVNLVAGAVTTTLGATPTNPGGILPQGMSRLWLHLAYVRSNVTAGDNDQLLRSVNSGPNVTLYDATLGVLLPAGTIIPVIGGQGRINLPAGTPQDLRGGVPRLQTSNHPLTILAQAPAAVGTITYNGIFVEIPERAPLPLEYCW